MTRDEMIDRMVRARHQHLVNHAACLEPDWSDVTDPDHDDNATYLSMIEETKAEIAALYAGGFVVAPRRVLTSADGEHFVSKGCDGERCFCGEPAAAKVAEELAWDDPTGFRHPLTQYVCRPHFVQIMGEGGVGFIEAARRSATRVAKANSLLPGA